MMRIASRRFKEIQLSEPANRLNRFGSTIRGFEPRFRIGDHRCRFEACLLPRPWPEFLNQQLPLQALPASMRAGTPIAAASMPLAPCCAAIAQEHALTVRPRRDQPLPLACLADVAGVRIVGPPRAGLADPAAVPQVVSAYNRARAAAGAKLRVERRAH